MSGPGSLIRELSGLLDNIGKQFHSAIGMKALVSRPLFVAAFAALIVFAMSARAQQNNNNASSSDRLDRLERRINEISERQQQFMRQTPGNPQNGQQAQMGGMHQPMPLGPVPPPQMSKARRDLKGLIGLCILGCTLFNILIAIWIFTDIRKRGTGSGVFIVLALIAGIPAAIIYSLVRIGDARPVEPVVRTP